MSGDRTLRFALAGYGAWGRLHGECLARADGAQLAAICCLSDRSAEAAAAAHPGAKISRNFDEVLQDGDIDAVDIVTPNHLHCEMGVAALRAGKHVLIEKPLAVSIDQCDRLVAAQRASGRVLSVGLELRLSQQWGKLREVIAAGDIGTPQYVHFSLFRHGFRHGSGGWRYDQRRVGSWILEETVHFVDLILWYLPPDRQPVAVRAHGSGGHDGMPANLALVLNFDADLVVNIVQCLSGFEHHLVLEIGGNDGALRSWWSGVADRTGEPAFGLTVQRGASGEKADIAIERSGEIYELEEEIGRTVTAMRAGEPLVSAEEARRSIAVCLEAERSIREQREIPLNFAN